VDVSVDPGTVVALVGAEVLYLRALRVLAGRGVAVPRHQRAAWHAGLALWVVGLLSPVDWLADDLLSAHMAQHLLIADLAAPLLLVGIRNPVLAFYLPRPALVTLARRRRLRRLLARVSRPLPALAIYVVVLYAWHLPLFFEAAVAHPLVHALQHASFVAIGVLVWWSALEPWRRRPQGALWKIGHILGARFAGMFLGMSFVIIRVPIYTAAYGSGQREGLTALADQQIAGAMMVMLDICIMVFALCFFFWSAAREADRAEANAGGAPRPTSP
jgi:putative membrane protein